MNDKAWNTPLEFQSLQMFVYICVLNIAQNKENFLNTCVPFFCLILVQCTYNSVPLDCNAWTVMNTAYSMHSSPVDFMPYTYTHTSWLEWYAKPPQYTDQKQNLFVNGFFCAVAHFFLFTIWISLVRELGGGWLLSHVHINIFPLFHACWNARYKCTHTNRVTTTSYLVVVIRMWLLLNAVWILPKLFTMAFLCSPVDVCHSNR